MYKKIRQVGWLTLLLALILAGCQSAEPEAVSSAVDEVASAETATTSPSPTAIPSTHTPVPPTEAPTATAPPPTPTQSLAAQLPIIQAAPNITNDTWLNTDEAITLESLRGKVVMLEFWTFG